MREAVEDVIGPFVDHFAPSSCERMSLAKLLNLISHRISLKQQISYNELSEFMGLIRAKIEKNEDGTPYKWVVLCHP